MSGTTLQVARECSSGSLATEPYDVVASASVGSDHLIAAPADWRRLDGATTRVAFNDGSWIQQLLNRLPPGQVLDLRSQSTGELIPVFLADFDVAALDPAKVAWCTRTPSEHGVMIVHDLIPLG